MSNRAIRNSQLNFDAMEKDKYEVFEALNQSLNNDMTIWTFLQNAQRHYVKVGGLNAHEYTQKVGKLTQNNHYSDLNQILSATLNFMVMESLEQSFQPHRSKILDTLKSMRDMYAQDANLRWGLSASHPHYNQTFQDSQEEVWNTLVEIQDEVADKFNGHNTNNITQPRFYSNMFNGNTDDEYLEQMVNHPTTYLFQTNMGYLVPYVQFEGSNSYYNDTKTMDLKNILNLTDGEIKNMVLALKEKLPRLHLELASLHEFSLANPQVASMAQSWTSRHRSDWCFFKQAYTDVSKKNTLSCGLISDLFGKHTPSFAGLKADWEKKMNQILDDIKKAEPMLEKAQNKMEEDALKTHGHMIEAITDKLNDMLTNGNDNDESDALTLIGNRAGVQGHHLNQNHVVSYYSVERATDLTLHLHWNTLTQYDIDLKGVILTDAQKQIITQRYNQRRQEIADSHAYRCAQLARQIANETSRHDTDLKTMNEAFTAYIATV